MNSRLSTAATLAVFGFLATACGKSKVDQCNAFIERANAAQTVINGLKFDSDDAAKLEGEAGKIEAEAKAVEAVEIKDEKLVKFKADYAANLTKLGGAMRELGKLHKDSKDPAKAATVEASAKKIEADAQKIEKDESALVNDINKYCSGS